MGKFIAAIDQGATSAWCVLLGRGSEGGGGGGGGRGSSRRRRVAVGDVFGGSEAGVDFEERGGERGEGGGGAGDVWDDRFVADLEVDRRARDGRDQREPDDVD